MFRTQRLRTVADVAISNIDKKLAEDEVRVRLCNYTDVYYADVINEGRSFMAATATPTQVRRFRLRVGQTLITKDSETPEDIGVAAFVAEAKPDLVCGYHLAILTPRTQLIDPRFLYWAMTSHETRDQLTTAALGVTRYGIRIDSIADLKLPIPSLDDQRRIVARLDAETARIDEVAKRKRLMIAALDKRRSAAAEELVLGMDGRMPAAGRYFRHVPHGWRETTLRHLNCRVQTGPFGSQLHASEYVEGGWPVVNPSNLRDGMIRPNPAMTISDEKRVELARHVLGPDDIVFGRRGEMGRAGLVTDREAGWLCGTGSLRLRLVDCRLSSRYLKLLLETRALRDYFELNSIGSTMDNLNTDIVLAMPVLVPPKSVQASIVDRHERLGVKVEMLVGRIARQRVLLLERRHSVIAAALRMPPTAT